MRGAALLLAGGLAIATPAIADSTFVRFTLPCARADSTGCVGTAPLPGVIWRAALIGFTLGQWPPETLTVRTYFPADSSWGCSPPDCPVCRRDSLRFDDRGLPWHLAVLTRIGPDDVYQPWSCPFWWARGWPVGVGDEPKVPADNPPTRLFTGEGLEWFDVAGRKLSTTADATWRPAQSGIYLWRLRTRGTTVRAGRFVHIR